MTILFSCVLVLMGILLLGLIEGARFYGLKSDAKEVTNLAAESLFAGYQPYLQEQYGMFFVDGKFGKETWNIGLAEDEMQALLYDNLTARQNKEGICLYAMRPIDLEVKTYALATDDRGEVFKRLTAECMKKQVPLSVAEKMLNKIKATKNVKKESKDLESYIEEANQALQEAERKSKAEVTTVEPATVSNVENPIEAVKEMKRKGVLALVLPPESAVSGKVISTEESLLHRTCRKGNKKEKKNVGWYARILMQEYVKKVSGTYLNEKDRGALSYGLEYIICGKEEDIKNLEEIVKKLLLLREGINFLYLQQNEIKKAEALAMASAIAGTSVNPLVIEAVKQGILAAWAYEESVSDVKTLMAGGRVALMKSPTEERGIGLSYEDYLDVLLYGKSDREIAYRCMDLMEKELENEYPNIDCKMDDMLVEIEVQAEYEGSMIFGNLWNGMEFANYRFLESAEYSYET